FGCAKSLHRLHSDYCIGCAKAMPWAMQAFLNLQAIDYINISNQKPDHSRRNGAPSAGKELRLSAWRGNQEGETGSNKTGSLRLPVWDLDEQEVIPGNGLPAAPLQRSASGWA